MTLADIYQQRCAEPCDINEHVAYFAELVVTLNAKTVIELGVRSGVSSVGWLYGLEQTAGHLWSVDIAAGHVPRLPTERWTFIQGDDLAPEVLAQLPDNADVVFIDTSHTFEQTANELDAYLRKVRPGGRLVLHDTELAGSELGESRDWPVKEAVSDFCEQHGFEWSNRPFCWGLATIQIPE